MDTHLEARSTCGRKAGDLRPFPHGIVVVQGRNIMECFRSAMSDNQRKFECATNYQARSSSHVRPPCPEGMASFVLFVVLLATSCLNGSLPRRVVVWFDSLVRRGRRRLRVGIGFRYAAGDFIQTSHELHTVVPSTSNGDPRSCCRDWAIHGDTNIQVYIYA